MKEDMNTTTSQTKPGSIRKMYLERRAELVRKTFAGHRGNLQGFLNQIATAEFNPTKDEILFSKTLRWMEENLHKDARINDIAKLLTVSVRKIQRLFALYAENSYTGVLLEMRIEQAKKYLAEHKNTVGQVGYLVGIPDHAYFTYLFRKTTGKTPSEYRLELMQNSIAS